MTETINIVYIDDSPESFLERFLNQEYQSSFCDTDYSEIIFNPSSGYESLLNDARVQTANIVLIDSRLFENKTVASGKFTGDEFKFVLQKFYPYIEVIVITQNGIDDNISMIAKFNPCCGKPPSEYYKETLTPCIDAAIVRIMQYRSLAEKLNKNDSWEVILKEKVLGTLNGTQAYDELTKEDIDKLIEAFKEIQEILDV